MLRLASPESHDRQIAVIGLQMLVAHHTDVAYFIGMCGCEAAQQSGILITTYNRPMERCVFCGKTVGLTRMVCQSEVDDWLRQLPEREKEPPSDSTFEDALMGMLWQEPGYGEGRTEA